jgi:hypothetical protein
MPIYDTNIAVTTLVSRPTSSSRALDERLGDVADVRESWCVDMLGVVTNTAFALEMACPSMTHNYIAITTSGFEADIFESGLV